MDKLLPGIITKRVPTSRLAVNVLSVAGRGDGPAVLFVHGNVSSSLFWQPLMLALPESYRPLAIDLRGFGDTDPEPVDATRGLRDYADDLAAVIDALGLESVHLIGWSMGGGVVLQYLVDRPGTHRVASLTLEDPVSPFGFGGTRGLDGTLCDPWAAGTGAGGANPEFVERLAAGDRSGDSPLSPRQVLLAHYVKPPYVPEHLDIFVESMLSTRIGDDHYPAPRVPSRPGPASRPATAACSTPWLPPCSGSPTCPGWNPSRRSCGCVVPTTSSSPTRPCTTWPTWARSARSRAGRESRPGRRSPWWRRPGRCCSATPHPAASSARW
jgi:pimeloyl-ACP methyl ester carboxylesterase